MSPSPLDLVNEAVALVMPEGQDLSTPFTEADAARHARLVEQVEALPVHEVLVYWVSGLEKRAAAALRPS